MNNWIKLFFSLVGLLVLVGCTGSASSTTPTQIPIPIATVAPDESVSVVVATEESIVLLEVVLYPAGGGISLESEQGGFGLGNFNWEDEAQVDLPEGYSLPRWILFHGIRDGKSFQLLIGPGDLSVQPDRIVHLPLTEEIRVPITQEGLTQVLFDGELPSCGEE